MNLLTEQSKTTHNDKRCKNVWHKGLASATERKMNETQTIAGNGIAVVTEISHAAASCKYMITTVNG